jgi:hypothetical protein
MLSVSCVNNDETETMNGYSMQQCVLRRMIKQNDIKEFKPALFQSQKYEKYEIQA